MRLIAVTSLLLAIGAAPAAASWSPAKGYDPAPAACRKHTRSVPITCVGEPAPRVAVNPSGAAVAVWRDLRDRVRAAVADRAGHFGAAVTLSARGLQPTAAITPDGTVTAIWTDVTGHPSLRAPEGGPLLRPRGATRRPRQQAGGQQRQGCG